MASFDVKFKPREFQSFKITLNFIIGVLESYSLATFSSLSRRYQVMSSFTLFNHPSNGFSSLWAGAGPNSSLTQPISPVSPPNFLETARILSEERQGEWRGSLGIWHYQTFQVEAFAPWKPLGIPISGLGVSRGSGRWVTGRARFYSRNVEEGDILIRELTQPGEDWVAMKKAGGIVTIKGGPLSHAAITARELGKHAVILEGATIKKNRLADEDELELVMGEGAMRIRIEEGDLLRVCGSEERGGIFVIKAGDWGRFNPTTKAQFYLEEVLWGSAAYDTTASRLSELIADGDTLKKEVEREAQRLLLYLQAAASQSDDVRLEVQFQLRELEFLNQAVDRVQQFADPADFHGIKAFLWERKQRLKKMETVPTGRRVESAGGDPVPVTDPVRLFYRLADVDSRYIPFVGGKFARLGDVAKMEGLAARTPKGIGLSASAFEKFLEVSGIRADFDAIQSRIDKALETAEVDSGLVEAACLEMQFLLTHAVAPERFQAEIQAAVEINEISYVPVAVRSSGILEDATSGAYAGMAKTYLNCIFNTPKELFNVLQRVWASFWEPAGVLYRYERHGGLGAPKVAVTIQEMIKGRVSGVAFSRDPLRQDASIMVTAGYGLGEGIVTGQVPSDIYRIDTNGNVQSRSVEKNQHVVALEYGGTELRPIEHEDTLKPCLTRDQVLEVAAVVERLKSFYGFDVDMEFTFSERDLHVLQVRPVTTSVLPSRSNHDDPIERATRLLKESEKPTFYFVCHGNRHRSALMHILMKNALYEEGLEGDVEVHSGGFTFEPDDMDPMIVSLCMEAGVHLRVIDEFTPSSLYRDLDEKNGGITPTLVLVAEQGMSLEVATKFPHLKDRIFAFNELAQDAFPGLGLDIEDPSGIDGARGALIGIQRGVTQDLMPMVRAVITSRKVAYEFSAAGVKTGSTVHLPAPAPLSKKDPGFKTLLSDYPDLHESFKAHGWGDTERDELLEIIWNAITGDTDYKMEPLPGALEDLANTGWPLLQQQRVLKFLVHLYGNQFFVALEDVELALLDKVDRVMASLSLKNTEKQSILKHLKNCTRPDHLRRVRDSFVKRHRFGGLALLRDHLGIELASNLTQVRALMSRLVAFENFKTADELELLGPLGVEIVIPPERLKAESDKRTHRVVRELNREKKILFEEITEFYLIQAIKKDLLQASRRKLSPELRGQAEVMRAAFVAREARIFSWIREYLIYAVHGELNHMQDHASSPLVGHVDIFLSGREGMVLDVETFMELATEEEIRLFFLGATQRFSQEEWGNKNEDDAGGPRWSAIAEMGLKMWEARSPDVNLIDLAFHLEHNNQMAFDKLPREIVMDKKDTLLLDLKRDVRNIDELYEVVEPRLPIDTKGRIQAWMRTLRDIQEYIPRQL